MAVNLSTLITLVRQVADMEGSQFVTDAEITSYINASGAELHDIIVSVYEDQFMAERDVTVSSGNTIALPDDFFKLRGLDFQISSDQWGTVPTFNFAERNVRSARNAWAYAGRRKLSYRVMGAIVYLLPETDALGTYRLWYIRKYSPLATADDQLDSLEEWHWYVVVDAAIRCLIKQESDVTALMQQKMELRKRIQDGASNRDAGASECIADTRDNDGDDWGRW